MSRLGKKPVPLVEGVKAAWDANGRELSIQGPKGTLKQEIRGAIDVAVSDKDVVFTCGSSAAPDRAKWGLYRQLTVNMVEGVTKGYEKRLEIVGAGYRAELKSKDVLNLFVGHNTKTPKVYKVDPAVTCKVENNGLVIIVSGTDKQKVGMVANEIRAVRKPDPYKGKGLRFQGEVVRKLAGKTMAAGKK